MFFDSFFIPIFKQISFIVLASLFLTSNKFHMYCCSFFTVNFEQISHSCIVFFVLFEQDSHYSSVFMVNFE